MTSEWEDEDGIDGPWERAMERAMREDERCAAEARAMREDDARALLDDLGFYDSVPCPGGVGVHHPGERCLMCGEVYRGE